MHGMLLDDPLNGLMSKKVQSFYRLNYVYKKITTTFSCKVKKLKKYKIKLPVFETFYAYSTRIKENSEQQR